MAGKKADRKNLANLLASVEAAGPDRYPDEYLFALQGLAEGPDADRYTVEKLAAAYLKAAKLEKAGYVKDDFLLAVDNPFVSTMISTGQTVALSSFTIRNGRAATSGALQNNGTLTLTGMTLNANVSTGDGGAFRNDGTATLICAPPGMAV